MFHYNNNFNLINIYSAKTFMFCFAIFFHDVARANFFLYALLGLCNFFFTNSSTPAPPTLPTTRSTSPSLTLFDLTRRSVFLKPQITVSYNVQHTVANIAIVVSGYCFATSAAFIRIHVLVRWTLVGPFLNTLPICPNKSYQRYGLFVSGSLTIFRGSRTFTLYYVAIVPSLQL